MNMKKIEKLLLTAVLTTTLSTSFLSMADENFERLNDTESTRVRTDFRTFAKANPESAATLGDTVSRIQESDSIRAALADDTAALYDLAKLDIMNRHSAELAASNAATAPGFTPPTLDNASSAEAADAIHAIHDLPFGDDSSTLETPATAVIDAIDAPFGSNSSALETPAADLPKTEAGTTLIANEVEVEIETPANGNEPHPSAEPGTPTTISSSGENPEPERASFNPEFFGPEIKTDKVVAKFTEQLNSPDNPLVNSAAEAVSNILEDSNPEKDTRIAAEIDKTLASVLQEIDSPFDAERKNIHSISNQIPSDEFNGDALTQVNARIKNADSNNGTARDKVIKGFMETVASKLTIDTAIATVEDLNARIIYLTAEGDVAGAAATAAKKEAVEAKIIAIKAKYANEEPGEIITTKTSLGDFRPKNRTSPLKGSPPLGKTNPADIDPIFEPAVEAIQIRVMEASLASTYSYKQIGELTAKASSARGYVDDLRKTRGKPQLGKFKSLFSTLNDALTSRK